LFPCGCYGADDHVSREANEFPIPVDRGAHLGEALNDLRVVHLHTYVFEHVQGGVMDRADVLVRKQSDGGPRHVQVAPEFDGQVGKTPSISMAVLAAPMISASRPGEAGLAMRILVR
jgi:hypothetical protein